MATDKTSGNELVKEKFNPAFGFGAGFMGCDGGYAVKRVGNKPQATKLINSSSF
ncbi:MAG: hypothetical protein RSC56_02335 [Acidaminococcaceae bacterium]